MRSPVQKWCHATGWALVMALLGASSHGAPTVYPTGVTLHDPLQAHPGLNLFVDPDRNRPHGEAVLMAMDGTIVHSWQSPIVGFETIHLAEPLDDGNVLLVVEASATQRMLVELDWDSVPVWQFTPAPGVILHHDFERLDNGNTLMLMRRRSTFPEVGPQPISDDALLEVDATGSILWEWSTAMQWAQLPLTTLERNQIWQANANGKAHVFHTNSVASLPPNQVTAIDPRFAPGNLLVSQRDTNIVMLIERATGDMIWFTKIAIGQHQPHMIPEGLPGAGNILLLDNGGEAGYPVTSRLYSQVLELDPLTGQPVWTYDGSRFEGRSKEVFLATSRGGAQRLPNGNTLIVEGAPWGRAFEVTVAGEIVWEYIRADDFIYRMYRVEESWPPAVARSERDRSPRRRHPDP